MLVLYSVHFTYLAYTWLFKAYLSTKRDDEWILCHVATLTLMIINIYVIQVIPAK